MDASHSSTGSDSVWIKACLCTAAALAIPSLYRLYFGESPRRHHRRGTDTSRIDPLPEHGGDLVAEVLAKHKVEFLFTLIGGHISPVLVGCQKRNIRVIDTRHEATAVFAADAISRLSGRVGVACVTAGPGLTNTITAVKNAHMAQSPLLLLGGATLGLLKNRGSLQDMNQQELFRGCVKWQASISRVCDIIPKLEEAFYRAVQGVPGPVFVELPIDVIYPEDIIRKQVVGKFEGKTGLVNTITQAYLNRYLNKMYGNGVRSEAPSIPWKLQPKLASNSSIEKAVEILKQSKKPLLLVGSQAVAIIKDPSIETGNDITVQKVVQSISNLGIPSFLAGAARGCLGVGDDSSPARLHIRHKRAKAIKQADVVVLLGVPCDFRLNYGLGIRRNTKLISVNIDREQLYLNWMNKFPALAIQAQVPDFLVRLSQAMQVASGQKLEWEDWRKELQLDCEKRHLEIQQQAQVSVNDGSSKLCNPLAVCLALEESLRDPSVLVGDGGDFIATAAYTVRPRSPQCWLDPGPFGTLGVGAGFAMAAKLLRPQSDVWLLWGDGSSAYGLMEYDTMVRHNIHVISVIGNDACWRQIHRDQIQFFDYNEVGCNLAFSDYHEVAKSLGGVGYVVDRADEMKVTIQNALEAAETKPVLINALIGKVSFRDGSISM